MTRLFRHVASAAAGAVVAALVVFGTASIGGDEIPAPRDKEREREPKVKVATGGGMPRETDLLLAWAPTGAGGLPSTTASLLERTKGVQRVTIAAASLDWMSSSTTTAGAQIDDPPPGTKIPVEIVAVDPAGYSEMAPPSDRVAISRLGPGEVLLSETSSQLRSYTDGMDVVLDSGRYSVAGVISDAAANGYEMVVAGRPPASWDIVDRFALILSEGKRTRDRVAKALKGALAPGQVLRMRARGETPYLRYGDAVMPQSIIKHSFGEFAARPLPDGTVAIDARWKERNIATERVPVLGEITCHRALFPQLREALREIRRRGLSFLIDTSQYGGCYGPRFIGRIAGGRLSHHAWGIAIDINAADNAFGTRPDLDPRLVEIMERAGFTWGGRWVVPDGMHFEWVRFP